MRAPGDGLEPPATVSTSSRGSKNYEYPPVKLPGLRCQGPRPSGAATRRADPQPRCRYCYRMQSLRGWYLCRPPPTRPVPPTGTPHARRARPPRGRRLQPTRPIICERGHVADSAVSATVGGAWPSSAEGQCAAAPVRTRTRRSPLARWTGAKVSGRRGAAGRDTARPGHSLDWLADGGGPARAAAELLLPLQELLQGLLARINQEFL